MGVVPRVQIQALARSLCARGKKPFQDLQNLENNTMKRAIERFSRTREKHVMAFVKCLRVSQVDTMEGSLCKYTLGRSLKSHDVVELVGWIFHGSGWL